MKLASWNCCGKFDSNLAHLLDLGIDVAVVSEARAPSAWPATSDGRSVTGLSRRVWADRRKELAVLACDPWSISLHPAAEYAPRWTLPVRVSGPTSFTLVGLWPVVFPGTLSYVAQIDRAVDWIAERTDEPVVLAGDFNAPIATSQKQFEKVVVRLEELGLLDLYRVTRGLGPDGSPAEATYYRHRRRDLGFHIDHVMLPAAWTGAATLEVGDFRTWIASGRSDHVPLIADVPTP